MLLTRKPNYLLDCLHALLCFALLAASLPQMTGQDRDRKLNYSPCYYDRDFAALFSLWIGRFPLSTGACAAQDGGRVLPGKCLRHAVMARGPWLVARGSAHTKHLDQKMSPSGQSSARRPCVRATPAGCGHVLHKMPTSPLTLFISASTSSDGPVSACPSAG